MLQPHTLPPIGFALNDQISKGIKMVSIYPDHFCFRSNPRELPGGGVRLKKAEAESEAQKKKMRFPHHRKTGLIDPSIKLKSRPFTLFLLNIKLKRK